MKIILVFILSLLLVTTLSNDSNESHITKQLKTIEQSALQTIENFYLLNLFNNPKVIFKNQTIYITLDINKKISDINTIEQFMNFKIFTKRIRFILKNHPKKDGDVLSKKEIIITGNTNGNSFKYTSNLINKELIHIPESYLSINEKIVLSSSEFNRVINKYSTDSYIEKVNGYDDIAIHRYARRLFKIMTKNGKYYNPNTDDQAIVSAVCEKFNITIDQYNKIDNKYYLLPISTEVQINPF